MALYSCALIVTLGNVYPFSSFQTPCSAFCESGCSAASLMLMYSVSSLMSSSGLFFSVDSSCFSCLFRSSCVFFASLFHFVPICAPYRFLSHSLLPDLLLIHFLHSWFPIYKFCIKSPYCISNPF